jgi:hypothetical protein
MELKLAAEWTNDCQGKKDYDGDIVGISTRYWPRGGGFNLYRKLESGLFIEEPRDDSIKPSAGASLVIWYGLPDCDRDDIVLASEKFEGETFEEVARQVESWAQEQMNRVVSILLREFGVSPDET